MMKILRRIFLALLALIVILYAGVWAISPVAVRSVLNDALAQHNILIKSSSTVRLNLFKSQITLQDIVGTQNNNMVFSLKEAEINYRVFRLLFDEIHLSHIMLSGVETSVQQMNGTTTVAGITFPVAPSPEKEPAPEPDDERAGGLPLAIVLDKISVKDVNVNLQVDDSQHRITLRKLDLDDWRYADEKLNGQLAMQLGIDGAQFTLDSDVVYQPNLSHATFEFNIQQFDPAKYRQWIPKNIQDISANIGLHWVAELKMVEKKLDLTSTAIRLSVDNLIYADANIGAKVNHFIANVPAMTVSADAEMELALEAGVEIDAENIELMSRHDKSRLMSVGKFRLDPSEIIVNADEMSLATPELAIDRIVVSEKRSEGEHFLPALAEIKKLIVSGIAFDLSHLNIEKVAIAALHSNVHMDQDGQFSTLVALQEDAQIVDAETPETVEKTPEEVQPENPSDIVIQVGEIVFTDPAQINIQDHSLNVPFEKTLVIDEFVISNIDSSQEESYVDFSFQLRDLNYFKHTISGKAQPFKPKVNFELVSKSSEFSLHEVSPYIEDALGFQVLSGQLDSTADIVVKDAILDGQTEIFLRGTKFSSKTSVKSESDVIGKTAVPLNVALGMLKDKKGNIELKIPLGGDIEDPSFGVHYIIGLVVKKAVMGQAKKHLINTFVPYGQVLSVAMAAGSYALKVRFEDLTYAPGQLELNEAQLDFTNQFAALLKDKKSLQVNICPTSVPQELALANDQALSQEQKQELLNIAKKRADTFKQAAIQKGVESSRLLICSPVIDDAKEAKPKLSFSI